MRSLFWLPTSLVLAAAALAQPAPPARLEVEYQLRRNGTTVAEITERLEQGNGSYHLTETWKGKGVYALLGKAKRTSTGTLGAEGPRPREFTDERSGRDTQRVWFDWNAKTITRRYKGPARTEALLPDTQDRLSFLFALTYQARKGQPISMYIADGRGLSHHVYQPDGRERLKTPAGEFDTLKLIRRNEGSGEISEIWFISERTYLPVRIVVSEKDGTRYEHIVTRLSPQ
jgi:hypothetical protein